MLTKRIIACLDVAGGRVVKGTNFINLKDAGDPVALAGFYAEEGADEVVFLDITATNEDRKTMLEIVEKTAANVFIPLTVGGGVKSIEDIRATLGAGADKVSLNSAAVKNPSLIRMGAAAFGSQCIVLAIDARKDGNTSSGWQVYTHGGRQPAGLDVLEWAQTGVEMGAGEILLTSMDRDGTGDGFDLELTALVASQVSVPIIASGGAGTLEHLYDGLTKGQASAVLAASIFHYGRYSIKSCKDYLLEKKISIRPC